jgi:hypothetical protein
MTAKHNFFFNFSCGSRNDAFSMYIYLKSLKFCDTGPLNIRSTAIVFSGMYVYNMHRMKFLLYHTNWRGFLKTNILENTILCETTSDGDWL